MLLEWFDPHRMDDQPSGGGDLCQADYSAYWSYDIAPLAATFEAGWIGESFPQARGDAAFTHEWYAAIGFDDSKWLGAKGPVLSPYIVYYQDVDDFSGAGRIDVQLSHCFALAQAGLGKSPFWKDVFVTPSLLAETDLGQITGHAAFAFLRYGLELTYDLSAALKLPPKYGRAAITGFVYYRQAFIDQFDDRLFGGLTLSYGW